MVQGYKQIPTMSGGQSQLPQQLISLLSGTGAQGAEQGLQSLLGMIQGTPESFQSFEAPAFRQFEEEILPSIAERLTARGAGGGRSSAAPQLFGQAGERLAENLAGQRGQLQQNAIQQLLGTYFGGSQQALSQQPFGYLQQSPSFGSSFGRGLGASLGSLLPGLLF